jgi:hypothetical protein
MMKRSFLLLALLALTALNARAEVDGVLSLNPAVVMLSGDYGQSTTQTIRLLNGTSRPFSFDLVARDVVMREGKRVFVDAGQVRGSIAATAVFSQKHVEVPPGETAVIQVTVTVPPGTGQRAVVALFRGTNEVLSGHVPMTASLGALLTFAMSSDVAMSADRFEVKPQSATSNLSVTASCTNSGSEPLVAKGVMAILNAKGSLVGKSALVPRRLLPGESTDIAGEYGGELDPGHYRVLVTYDYEGQVLTRSAEIDVP